MLSHRCHPMARAQKASRLMAASAAASPGAAARRGSRGHAPPSSRNSGA